MKLNRQEKILEIIAREDIETQEQLLDALKQEGFKTTQATISRDIKDLRIVKELSSSGAYRYAASRSDQVSTASAKLNTIFRECATSCDCAQNLLVIKTMPGLANAACSAVDAMNLPSVVGTLAGDDTALIILRDSSTATSLCTQISKLIRN
ncbi:MAG: arginine repressor [Oscillospiraceae bacterium]|jgi:transcriptional regulator of arginine metabolism|nr:arginine repressor [Oscillospiraceae bacterium]